MSASMDANRLCGKANRRLLGLVSETGGCKFRYLPFSKSRGKLYNVGTVGGWIVGVGGGLAVMFMLTTRSSTTIDPSCCLFETARSAHVYQSARPYMHGGS